MRQVYTADETFNARDFSETAFPPGEYEGCTFSNCRFSNVDLSGYQFTDCHFEHCDLSLVTLKDTAFRPAHFRHCKLMGLHFDDCNHFSLQLSFDTCILNFASFFRLKLKGTGFNHCKLEAADFTEADLSNASFANADLTDAVFEHSNLGGADLSAALNFSIDPETNNISGAKFSVHNVAGLLKKHKIRIVG